MMKERLGRQMKHNYSSEKIPETGANAKHTGDDSTIEASTVEDSSKEDAGRVVEHETSDLNSESPESRHHGDVNTHEIGAGIQKVCASSTQDKQVS